MDILVFYIFLWNICNILKYKNGWGKFLKKGDKSIVVCIEKIKNERNLIFGYLMSFKIIGLNFGMLLLKLRNVWLVEIYMNEV